MKDKLEEIKESNRDYKSASNPKCWICKDSGMVFYNKLIRGISYDFSYRCKCKTGQSSSQKIKTVPKEYGEKIALNNFNSFKEKD